MSSNLPRRLEDLRARMRDLIDDPDAVAQLEREARALLTDAKNTPHDTAAQALFAELARMGSPTSPTAATVRGLLRRDPAQRLTLDQVRGSPWLRDMGALPSAPLPPIVLQRMRAFTAMTRFKKAAVLCAARHLNRDQIQGLRELFKSFDKNGKVLVGWGGFLFQ